MTHPFLHSQFSLLPDFLLCPCHYKIFFIKDSQSFYIIEKRKKMGRIDLGICQIPTSFATPSPFYNLFEKYSQTKQSGPSKASSSMKVCETKAMHELSLIVYREGKTKSGNYNDRQLKQHISCFPIEENVVNCKTEERY